GTSVLSSIGKRDETSVGQVSSSRVSLLGAEQHDSPRLLSTSGSERQAAVSSSDRAEKSSDDDSGGLVELDPQSPGISKKKLWSGRPQEHQSREAEEAHFPIWNYRLWDFDVALHEIYRASPLVHLEADSGEIQGSCESSDLIELLAGDLGRLQVANLQDGAPRDVA